MSVKHWLKHHPSFSHNADFNAICQPIFDLGMSYFSHAQVDIKKKTVVGIGSCPDFLKLYLEKGYHQYDLHMLAAPNSEQHILWDAVERKRESKSLHEDFMSFNRGHTFTIVTRHGDMQECFHFAAKLGDSAMNHTYLQKIDVLKKFILHYKDKISQHKELRAVYDMPLSIDNQNAGHFIENPHESFSADSLEKTMKLKRIYLHGFDAYITPREFQCLYWLARGKTLEEISMIIHASIRTVKAHVAHMKEKLGCTNQFQLGAMFAKLESLL